MVRSNVVLAVGALGAVGVLAACGSGSGSSSASSSATSFTVTGSVTDQNESALNTDTTPGGSCTEKGYEAGTAITITGADGTTVVAKGKLEGGKITMDMDGLNYACVFHFKVPNVPTGQSSYWVKVGPDKAVNFNAEGIQQPIMLTTTAARN